MRATQAKKLGLLLAFSVLAICTAIGQAGPKPITGVGILLASLILWTTEALPMSITTMLMICMIAWTGIMTFDESIAGITAALIPWLTSFFG